MRNPSNDVDAIVMFMRGNPFNNDDELLHRFSKERQSRLRTVVRMIQKGHVQVSQVPTLPESDQVLFVIWFNGQRFLEPSCDFPSDEIVAQLFIFQEFSPR